MTGFPPFVRFYSILLYVYGKLCTHSSIHGYWGCFYLLVIMNSAAIVTMQHGVQLLVALCAHDPKICVEGNMFLLIGFQFVGAESTPETQNFSCSPEDYKPKPPPEVPHFLICPFWRLRQPCN